MNPFDPLGEAIASAWRARGNDERSFPAIAREKLAAPGMVPALSYPDIIRWFQTAETLPEQRSPESRFGSPPLTVYSGSRFYIEVLCWMEGHTSIHQHGFSGAFTVLSGRCVHCRYVFDPAERVNARFLLGNLSLREAEILGPGDCRSIEGGSSFIHSNFHLDRPTVTLVVRTATDPDADPQFQYWPPHVAFDPFYRDPVLDRRLRSLEFLLAAKPLEYFPLAEQVLDRADFEMVFGVLQQVRSHVRGSHLETELLARARAKFGDRVDAMLRTIDWKVDVERLRELRKSTSDAQLRLALAIIENVPSRAMALEALGRAHPNREPVRWLSDSLARLIAPEPAVSCAAVGSRVAFLLMNREVTLREDDPIDCAIRDSAFAGWLMRSSHG